MQKEAVKIIGIQKTLIVDHEVSLADVLRGQMGLTGTKVGCGTAHCAACSVILNGKLVRSCATKMKRVEEGAAITTVEGIGTPDDLHPIQAALVAHGVHQCGFCMPGFVASSRALLKYPLRETPRLDGPFGAAGVGELPLTSPHAAIVNAIHNACGMRITKLPALPEKVLAGLQAK